MTSPPSEPAAPAAVNQPAAAPNLTRDQKLVVSSAGLSPVPNHYLVVYKRSGEGWTFRECLQPGRKPRRLPFESPAAFTTHAVVADRELRHRFERDYRSHDQVHEFTLDLTVEFRVSSPKALVGWLERDPLRLLEEEIGAVLVQAAKGLDWSFIEREHIDLEHVLFGVVSPGAGQDPVSHLAKLRRFAAGLGFEVRRIAVARRLPPGEVAVPAEINRAAQEQQIAVLKSRTAEVEKTLSQELEHKLGGRTGQFERGQKLAEAVADSTAAVFGREIDAVRSLPELSSALQEVAGVYSAIQGGGAQSSQVLGPVLAAGSAGPPPALLGAGRGDGTPLAALLSDLVAQLGGAAGGPAIRQQILPSALHLVAEILRRGEASPLVVE
ncbi:MAG: hypothetical protein M3O15_02665, partial [Acidobacteriota bacterium]|nr:hypothetical protein [Acidobacteriota bacterium]